MSNHACHQGRFQCSTRSAMEPLLCREACVGLETDRGRGERKVTRGEKRSTKEECDGESNSERHL